MNDETSAGQVYQAFECEVCGQKYELESEYTIDRITVDCNLCDQDSVWCYPVDGGVQA